MTTPQYSLQVVETFVGYLKLAETEPSADFESFCESHPEHSESLRELHGHWLHTQTVVAHLRGHRTVREAFAEELGTEASVTLDTPPEPDAAARVTERLETLEESHERYRTVREIARGGMGIVSKVWDGDLRRNLAMKVMQASILKPADTATQARRFARFLEEAQITGQLAHPGVVPVYDLGIDDEGRVYYTMQYVKGHDLRHVFELARAGKEGWNEHRALSVLVRVCEAMAYAHSKKVLHRDLKPSNVMVGRYGQVYVMDWGIARVMGREDPHDNRVQSRDLARDHTESTIYTDRHSPDGEDGDSPLFTMDGDVLGTPAYMSPEQAHGELGQLDARSDVYSIGAMLYQLLTGQRPYCPEGARIPAYAVWAAVTDGPPRAVTELRPDVPPELAAICTKAMARQPANRYPNMEALGEDLRAYTEHRVVGAYETGLGAEMRKWIGRNRALAAAALVAVVITIGLGTTSYVAAKGRRDAEAARERLHQPAIVGKAMKLARDEALLWPPAPETVPAYERWIEDAREVATDKVQYERDIESLEARGNLSADESWTFEDLTDLLDVIRKVEPGSELFDDIESRLEFASSVEERTITGPDARAKWDEAIAAIADPSSPYDGLRIEPQLGLLPIGADPDSGLWEFAHLQTGILPKHRPDGRNLIEAETALIFVLIPGGKFYMGAQRFVETSINHDPRATSRESPVQAVVVSPFFLSKCETTQSQWVRVMGPWQFSFLEDDRLPAESVSWERCQEFCRRTGLALPDEAVWEYAARANVPFPYWTGKDEASLQGAENLFGEAAASATEASTGLTVEPLPFSDGWPHVGPVGRLRPNPFGLHDVLGNVSEWCSVHYYAEEDNQVRVGVRIRGGAFDSVGAQARVSYKRMANSETHMSNNVGFRPARRISRNATPPDGSSAETDD